MSSLQTKPRAGARPADRVAAPSRSVRPGSPRRGRILAASPFRFRPVPIAGLNIPALGEGRQAATPPRRQAQRRAADRLATSEARLVGVAVAVTITFCLVLVVYLGEYAQATRLSIELLRSNQALHKAREDSELLKDRYAAARSPERIIAEAQAQGMELSRGRVCYVGQPPAMDHVAGAAADGDQSDRAVQGTENVTRLASSETHPRPGSRAATTN